MCRAQRRPGSAPAIEGRAESLPFPDRTFDVATGFLTVHHWNDWRAGLAEAQRVAERVLLLTWNGYPHGFWLMEYFPALQALDKQQMPLMSDYQDWLGSAEVSVVPIPAQCTDGFLCAYWQRPEAYLDEKVRAAMSSFWKIGDLSAGLQQLDSDLTNGRWEERYGHLRSLDALACGYRLVVSAAEDKST